MAKSEKTTPGGWVDSFLTPDDVTERQLRYAGRDAVDLVACGRMWDAVVISPLERGLVALDSLGLGLDIGHVVFADYRRHELIIFARPGTAAAVCGDVQGLRVLSRGSWLLVPCGSTGSWGAASLSRPIGATPRYVDLAALSAALLAVDEERSAYACVH